MPKKNLKIKFNFDNDVGQREIFFIANKTRANIQKLSTLFPYTPVSITIHSFSKRTAFLKAVGINSAPRWLVASVPPRSTSDIFLHRNQKKLGEANKIDRVILHELTHLYTNSLNPNLPDWVKEDISVYIAQQINKLTISTENWKKIIPGNIPFEKVRWQTATKYDGYNIAGLLVRFLVKKYGLKRFLNALDRHRLQHFSWNKLTTNFNEDGKILLTIFKNNFVKK